MATQLKLPISQPPSREVFWKKMFSPMLAWNKEFALEDVKLPVYVSEKIDGIRCIIHDGGIPRTRDNKPIPNDYIRNTIRQANLPAGFDGELITINKDGSRKTFHEIQSDIMSTDGEPKFQYLVFDYVTHENYKFPFYVRQTEIVFYVGIIDLAWLYPVRPIEVESLSMLQELCDNNSYLGEGSILRSPDGKYKFGRSTFNEQLLLKVTPWRRDEAICYGVEEEMINDDPRTKCKANLRPAGTLGKLVVGYSAGGKKFRIGSGFTRELKNELWDNRKALIGKTITFKYKPYGTKDVPRTPIFVGIRLE